jgi:hypothetical protein
MSRFYFELSNGQLIRDHEGLDCNSEAEAKRAADMVAGDIAREAKTIPKKHLTVVDEEGRDIYQAPIKKDDGH